MKKNIISIMKNQELSYKKVASTFLLVCLLILSGNAQKVTKTFEKEIEVSENTVIKTSGPQSVHPTGKGAINTRQSGNKYIISGKASKPYIYIINKTLKINTWQHNKVKQVVEVILECENKIQNQDLLNALKIELKKNAAGQIIIDTEMNIQRFKIYNNFFRKDDNSVVLNNGKEYKIKYLELTTSLFIPEKSNLILNTQGTTIDIDNHKGTINLTMDKGNLIAKKMNVLTANLKNVDAKIHQITNATISLKNVTLTLNEVNELGLKSEISLINIGKSNTLLINESINDQFIIDTANDILVTKSLFSDYKISSINNTIEVNAKNSDITVNSFDKKVTSIDIQNQNASIKLVLKNLDNYTLSFNDKTQNSYHFPNKLKALSPSSNQLSYTYGTKPSKTKIIVKGKHCDVKIE